MAKQARQACIDSVQNNVCVCVLPHLIMAAFAAFVLHALHTAAEAQGRSQRYSNC